MLANNSPGWKTPGLSMLMVWTAPGYSNQCRTVEIWRYDKCWRQGYSSGFRNYGAWVEGAGSNVNVPEKSVLPVRGLWGFLLKMAESDPVRQWCSAIWQQRSDRLYVYGKDSAIHNTGSGVMDVSLKTQHYSVLPAVRHSRELQSFFCTYGVW